jgi:hypothetical protein
MKKPFNHRIYFNNVVQLENHYTVLQPQFLDHDAWVNFIDDQINNDVNPPLELYNNVE